MCLAVPVKVLEIINEKQAAVAVDGVGLKVSTMLITDLKVDEYVLIHAGFIIERLTNEDAQDKLSLYDEYLEKTGQKK